MVPDEGNMGNVGLDYLSQVLLSVFLLRDQRLHGTLLMFFRFNVTAEPSDRTCGAGLSRWCQERLPLSRRDS
jgi:hypothetical protein